jgi:hypothetical protein
MDPTINPAVQAAQRAIKRQEIVRKQRETDRRSHERERKQVTDNKKAKEQHAHAIDNASDRYAAKYQHEEATPKRKYIPLKDKPMGFNAYFGKKKKSDDCGPADMAQNAYESRFVIPFERQAADKVEIGFDKDVEPSDVKKQLKRRKAMKLVKAFQEGVWGNGGGGYGVGGAADKDLPDLSSKETSKNYKLQKKNRIFKGDSAVGGARITPNS